MAVGQLFQIVVDHVEVDFKHANVIIHHRKIHEAHVWVIQLNPVILKFVFLLMIKCERRIWIVLSAHVWLRLMAPIVFVMCLGTIIRIFLHTCD